MKIEANTKNTIMYYVIIMGIIYGVGCSQALEYGENLIINGNFAIPKINYFSGVTDLPGWSCIEECQIDSCRFLNVINNQNNITEIDCSGQVMDLDSKIGCETISQLVDLKTGEYSLTLDYFTPNQRPEKKVFLAYFNGIAIYQSTPLIGQFNKKISLTIELAAKEGMNNISFSMKVPNSYIDGIGFKITNITLRRVENKKIQTVINDTISNSFFTAVIGFPGSRFLLSQIMHFFISFDRLQFYYYHRRIQSYYDQIFLKNINDLLNMKGTFFQSNIEPLNDFIQGQEDYISSLDEKSSYSSYDFKQKNENGDGFVLNNESVAAFTIPFIAIMQLILALIYSIFSRNRIISHLRRYCLGGTFFLILMEGNIEQFTFYIFSEFNYFFSISFKFKLVNVVLLLFFSVVLFTACAFYMWAKYHYKKLSELYCDEMTADMGGIFCSSIDKGGVYFFFGFVHRVFLDYPSSQLLVLIFLELLWLTSRIIFLRKDIYKNRKIVILDLVIGTTMIGYQVSCFLYSEWQLSRPFIHEYFHLGVIFTLMGLWACETIVYLVLFIKETAELFRKKWKIVPLKRPTFGQDNKAIFDKKKQLRGIQYKKESLSPKLVKIKLKKEHQAQIDRFLQIKNLPNGNRKVFDRKSMQIK